MSHTQLVGLPECPSDRACLRPNAIIEGRSPAYPESETAVDGKQAAWLVAEHLVALGVSDIQVFDVQWIAAPLSGFLVNATGAMDKGDVRFRAFCVGVRDGFEADGDKRVAGEKFAYMAVGYDEEGALVWSPDPGSLRPGYEDSYPCELLAYNFLSLEDRQRLEQLLRWPNHRPE